MFSNKLALYWFFLCFISFLSNAENIKINLFDFTNSKYSVKAECIGEHVKLNDDNTQASFELHKGEGKRCEIVLNDILQLDEPFDLSFEFSVPSLYINSEQWHALFQIHGFPDLELGEKWRCPVVALESYKGQLRMFNRWDKNKISKPSESGGCSDKQSSIRSRVLFQNIAYKKNVWNTFRLKGTLGQDSAYCLDAFLNEKHIGHKCGTNAYNDKVSPYFKFGIYKPTSWDSYSEFNVKIKNIKVDKNEN